MQLANTLCYRLKKYIEIEKALEDYALGKYMEENGESGKLSFEEAKAYYKRLKSPGERSLKVTKLF